MRSKNSTAEPKFIGAIKNGSQFYLKTADRYETAFINKLRAAVSGIADALRPQDKPHVKEITFEDVKVQIFWHGICVISVLYGDKWIQAWRDCGVSGGNGRFTSGYWDKEIMNKELVDRIKKGCKKWK